MSFINKDEEVSISIKLTTIGRKKLASGALTFDKWVLGDSEIDYTYCNNTGFDPIESIILRPKDKNPNIKYPIKSSDSAIDQFNILSPIVPIETRIRNSATERGFFNGSVINGFTAKTDFSIVVQNTLKITLSEVTGGTTIQIKQDTGFTLISEPLIGDYVYINWVNPAYTGSTYSEGVVYTNNPTPNLWYKIQSKTGTIASDNLIVTLDRNLPNFNGQGGSSSASCLIYPGGDSIDNFYGSGDTLSYWNENTLAFNSTCNIANDDVAVWNMNIVYSEDIAGKQSGFETYAGFGSSGYTGFKNYLSQTFDNPTQKSLGIIHYTNHSINNYYGEQFYNNTPILELPTVIWHKSSGNTMGLTLKCDSIVKTSVVGSGATDLNTTYYDLIDTQGNVVGKCFINLKLFTIEDEELIAALSYKSNRNYSLPTLTNAGLTSGIPVTRPNVFTDINQKLYVTYLFQDSSGYTSNISYGYGNSLHCQNYTTYTPTVVGGVLNNNQVPQFTIDISQLQFLTDSSNFGNGIGITASNFKILYQLVNDTNTRPDSVNWKEYDFTSKLNGYPFSGPIPTDAFNGFIYSIDNNVITGGTTYNVNNYVTMPLTSEGSVLQFGDEVFFYGNVKTDIEATVFKTKFIVTLPFNQFNTSQNPTWIDSDLSVYISEMGIYDLSNNLIGIGKFNYPIEKKNSQIRVIELSIDF